MKWYAFVTHGGDAQSPFVGVFIGPCTVDKPKIPPNAKSLGEPSTRVKTIELMIDYLRAERTVAESTAIAFLQSPPRRDI